MIALYLIAAHMVGDYLLQNRWMTPAKFTDTNVLFEHVTFYCVPFVPIAVIYTDHAWQAGGFMACLWLLHALTDRRRFHSNIGDVVQWRLDWWRDPATIRKEWLTYLTTKHQELGATPASSVGFTVNDEVSRWPTPNPWPTLPLMIDQTLHLCQLAVLGGLLLR